MALAAGASLAAAAPADDHRIALLSTDQPPTGSTPAPHTEDTPAQTPSVPLVLPSDNAGGSDQPGADSTAAGFIDSLQSGTELSYQREITEELARRPSVALPATGTSTSSFGPRWGTTHSGLDVANTIGTPLFAATDGIVIDSGPASGFGIWIRIMSPDGFMTVYGHNESNTVQVGDTVVAGQQIGVMGNRGFSTGPHVHFEVWADGGSRAIDPSAWLAERGVIVNSGPSSSPL
ncbi:peptidase M23-like protein [Dietzia cinnamea]|uniref:Peptidase M23-like protein n=1 Tax=Dietzia cinnamea TaxID=321318 RepID=A0A4R3ZQ26_9ACTN|nr:peptidase M23-like protein [Dietzia cinnamea]